MTQQVRMEIDPLRLDEEWRRHPQAYYNAGRAAADAEAAYEQARINLDIIWAECDKDIREDPKAYGLEKVTEGAVEATIKGHGAYTAAKKRMLEAKHEKDIANVAVDALDHRRRALDALTKLFLADYYAADGPRPAAGEGQEAWADRAALRARREAALSGREGEDDDGD